MKKLMMITILSSLFFFGCKDEEAYVYDYTPPSAPSGLFVLNGDNIVDISWNHNRERDLAGYNVYFSYSYNGRYELIGSTQNNYFTDYDAFNGVKYYYAIAAYDLSGNESDLSYDVSFATPRPEGFNQSIFDYRNFPNNSGYSFDKNRVYPFDDNETDFFFENFGGVYYLDVWEDTDIIDMGPTTDIYDIPFAPNSGWSSTKDELAKVGHTYVIWTWDNHFAKIRIKSITSERVVFDWAYQTVEGNSQLKAKFHEGKRKKLTRGNIR